MPELPEVESIVRSLDKKISGKKIYRISVLRKNILQLSQKKFSTILLQQKIQRVFRYGKYIIFELENLYLWVVHLRMSGKFIYPAQKKPALHDRVLFELDDKTLLSYNDVRCFGTMELLEKRLVFSEIKKLGLDALDSGWTKENFYQKMHNKKISVKDFLLEQSQIAGIGNIYACEILFDSKISPLKMSNKVSKKEAEKILQSINFILLLAIKKNGTSISDYRGIDNKTGEFQNFLKVYGKKNTPCFDCGKTIQKIKQRQRSTYYCPSCQKH